MEAIKTAYCPGFKRLVSLAKSGKIGEIKSVDAAFTKLVPHNVREMQAEHAGGSVTELATYPLYAIFKLLGSDYKDVRFVSCMKNGVDIFTLSYNSQEDNPDYFLLKSGDIVNIKFEYVTSPVPGYKATLTVNDKTPFVLPYIAENIVDVFPDGKAHIAIDCNLKGSKENEFTYTLTDLKNGTEKTQEQIDAVAGLREAAAKEAKKADVLKKSESARKRVEAALETAKNANVAEAIAKAEEGVAALEAFNAAVEAENYDEAQTHLTFAGDCAKESGKLVRAAEKAEREQQAATGETKEEANENVEVVEEESSSNVGLIIAIIVIAVIVIAAVIVIVLKKKKN